MVAHAYAARLYIEVVLTSRFRAEDIMGESTTAATRFSRCRSQFRPPSRTMAAWERRPRRDSASIAPRIALPRRRPYW
jgi:hypothetical protein